MKKSDASSTAGGNLILNGRAALCAGKDDMSSEDDEAPAAAGSADDQQDGAGHRFNKPDNFKTVLESGAIPDAAMIHAARKRRQKAREEGNFNRVYSLVGARFHN